MSRIETIEDLRKIYKEATGRAAEKVISRLEKHSLRFIELSPFLVIATIGADNLADVSPRGEKPGFVRALDDTTLAIPDRPGNNRLDTFSNLLVNPTVGLIFFIPGVDEVLRINGHAEIRDDEDLRNMFAVNGKLPATVLVVSLKEAYLHCAKAIMRAELWDERAKIDRALLPTMGRMMKDQIGTDIPVESQEELVARHRSEFY